MYDDTAAKKLILDNDVTNRKKPDSSSEIYITAAKVLQYRLVADNRREKEEAKNKTSKKIAAWKLCLQKKRSEAFQ